MASKFKFVLCLDDNEADLFYNRFILEQSNISEQYLEFTEFDEAIQCLEKFNALDSSEIYPSLMILDLNMPMYNGVELIEKYNSLFESLKRKGVFFLILTTSQNPNDIRRVKENTIIEAYVQKPFILENIEHYLTAPIIASN